MNRKLYNELKAKVENLEKQINGGKGSGNFGHAGRPGERGGSAPEGSVTSETSTSKSFDGYKEHQKHNFEVEYYTSSTAELKEFFPEGSEFYFDGDRFTVQDGDNGLEGVSDDGKRVVSIPSETLDQTSDYVGKGENPIKRLSAFQEIVSKMREHGFPANLCDEVGRYAVVEHDLFATDKDKTEGLKRVDSYADSARGGIMGYALGNGGIEGPMSNYNQRLLKAISEQIYRGQRGAHEALENEATNSFVPTPQQLAKSLNGGKGSGNFGHKGRPGEVGGSGDGKGVTVEEKSSSKTTTKTSGMSEGEVWEKYHDKKTDPETKAAMLKQVKKDYKIISPQTGWDYIDELLDSGEKSEFERFAIRKDEYEVTRRAQKDIFGKKIKDVYDVKIAGEEIKDVPIRALKEGLIAYKDAYLESKDWSKDELKKRASVEFESMVSSKKLFERAGYKKRLSESSTKNGLRNRATFEELKAKVDSLEKIINGGKGSGNFGHAGRPGKIGGSAPEGAASAGQSTSDSAWAWAKQLQQEYLEKVTKHLEQARGDFYRDYQRYELVDGQYVKKQPDMNDKAYKAALKKIEDSVDEIRALNVKSEDLQTQKDNAKIARIEEKIGKKALLVAKDFEGGSASTFMDEDGKEYWYDKRSERVKDYGGEKEYRSPAFDKAMKDKTPWNEYEITGAQIKKKLKGYGINTEGLTVSKGRGGYETAWHISGDSRKTDLKAVEDIVKTKIGHVDYDERSGEILAGGNTFVFVSDTDKNMLYQKLSNKLDELALALNGGKGSGNFGHSGRPGLVGGSGDGTGVYSKGEKVSFQTAYGEWVDAKIVRKLSDAEKKERAALANPYAGDYYEVQGPVGKHIVWEGKIKTGENESDIAKEYESRSEELGKLSDKIETALEEKLETTVSKKQAEDFITAVIGYNAKNLDKEEREELASDLMDDLKYVRSLKSKKVTIRLNPMSATNMTFEEA